MRFQTLSVGGMYCFERRRLCVFSVTAQNQCDEAQKARVNGAIYSKQKVFK